MKQALHIFLKDARCGWPYIAIVLAITAALAYLTPMYVPWFGLGSARLSRTVTTLQFFLPVAWWFTIAHVVHVEALVGDRQFWVTRPYSWRSLLLAKMLFCVAFLSFPLLAQDFIVLSATGFPPTQMIPELLWRHCWLAAILMLPAFVLAALTRNIRQFVLACLSLVIALLVPGFVESSHPSKPLLGNLMDVRQSAAISWIENWGPGVFFIAGALALLLWQYARRRSAYSRAIVMAAYALNLASTIWSARPIPPAVWESAVSDTRYPEVAVAFTPARGRLNRRGASGAPNKVQIDIPIELTGRNRDLLRYDIAALSMEPEHGDAWSSHEISDIGVAPREDADWIELHLDGKDFQRLNRGPLKVHAMFGVTVYEEQARLQLRQDAGWSEIPGLGSAEISGFPEVRDLGHRFTLLLWRAPLHSPSGRFLCSIRNPASDVLYQAEWAAMYPGIPDYLHISPVVSFAASFRPKKLDLVGHLPRFPEDAPCEFTFQRPLALVRRDLQITGIRLEDYVVGPATP